jgi:hypothetical protein
VAICLDEFGPLNLQPHPGHHDTRDRRLGKIVNRADVA